MDSLTVKIARVGEHAEGIALPAYATAGSAGMDICAANLTDIEIKPGEAVLIPTGFSIELPPGFEAQIRPRSGLAIRHRIGILNSPGTIDADYRGEVKIVLMNFGSEPYVVKRGDRIAQMVIQRFERAEWVEVESLEMTLRGAGGFGHTGISGENG